jgi:hypothetical protein
VLALERSRDEKQMSRKYLRERALTRRTRDPQIVTVQWVWGT